MRSIPVLPVEEINEGKSTSAESTPDAGSVPDAVLRVRRRSPAPESPLCCAFDDLTIDARRPVDRDREHRDEDRCDEEHRGNDKAGGDEEDTNQPMATPGRRCPIRRGRRTTATIATTAMAEAPMSSWGRVSVPFVFTVRPKAVSAAK